MKEHRLRLYGRTEKVICFLPWQGGGDTIQVSLSHAQSVLIRIQFDVVYLRES
jgi:hypothetical protein